MKKEIPISQKQFTWLIVTVIFAIIGYFLFTLWAGWKQVLDAVVRIGFSGIAIALSLSLVNYFLRFLRWNNFLHTLGCYVPFWRSLRIYLAGFSLTTTPAKSGEAIRSIYLTRYGLAYRKSLAAFFAERLSDLMAVLIISVIGLWKYRDGLVIELITLSVVALVFLFLWNTSWIKAVEEFARRRLPEKFAHIIEFGLDFILAFRSCFSMKVLFYAISLSVVAWLAEGLAFYYMLHLLGADIDILTAVFIYAFSLMVGGVTLLPGGLGGAEVTMWQLLLFFGVPSSVTVAVTIMIRLTTLWFSVLLGIICLPRKI
jgi:glycosyltransferase 2 family protein